MLPECLCGRERQGRFLQQDSVSTHSSANYQLLYWLLSGLMNLKEMLCLTFIQIAYRTLYPATGHYPAHTLPKMIHKECQFTSNSF